MNSIPSLNRLLAIGQNPILIDRKLEVTPNEWLIPVAKSAKGIRAEIEKVRTLPQQIQKASEEAVRLKWCGLVEVFRTKYYKAIVNIAKEMQLSKQYLGEVIML